MVNPIAIPSNPIEALLRLLAQVSCGLSSTQGCAVIQ